MANQNILTISDSDNEKISYSKSSVKSEYLHIKTLNDLLLVFNSNNEDIFDCNTIGTVTLIKDDNTEISLHQYRPDNNIAFIKISDECLFINDCEILLSVKNMSSDSLALARWDIRPEDTGRLLGDKVKNNGILNAINLSEHDIVNAMAENADGYLNCNGWIKEKDVCAIDKCNEYIEIFNNIAYHGYLPSIYQLKVIHDYQYIINYIMDYIGFNNNIIKLILPEKYNNDPMQFWSSTIAHKCEDFNDMDINGYIYAYDMLNGKYEAIHRTSRKFVLPIFKQLRNDENN